MKVLFLTYLGFPLEIGGFQNQVKQIYENLIKQGVDVEWYSINKTIVENYDLIHIFATDPSFLPIVKKAKQHSIPVLLTPMRGSRVESNFQIRTKLFLSQIPGCFTAQKQLCAVIREADFFAPLSSFEAQRLRKVYGIPHSKMKVICNGIDNCYKDDDVVNLPLPYEDYYIIVGRIEPNKNQYNLIKAVNRINKNLIIVGDIGVGSSEYYEKCKRISAANVFYWGKELNPLILKSLYCKAKGTVIASYSEMVPLVIYESLACKTPVLCTKRCSISNEKMDGVFFVDVNEDALVEGLLRMDGLKVGDVSIPTWDKVAYQYLEIYNQLI